MPSELDTIRSALEDSMTLYEKVYGAEEAVYWKADCKLALAYLDTLTPSAGMDAPIYSHRNGEADEPRVEGRYWIRYIDEGFPTVIWDIWRFNAKMWTLLPRFQSVAIYGPIPLPNGDAPPVAQQQLSEPKQFPDSPGNGGTGSGWQRCRQWRSSTRAEATRLGVLLAAENSLNCVG